MNRIDKAVVLVIAFFLVLALLKAALNVAAELAALVVFLGVVYFAIRLWRAGKFEFLKSTKPAVQPAEKD
jgi:hypothetical protein